MGAPQSSCCSSAENPTDRSIEEWGICKIGDDCVAPEDKANTWAPMQVSAMKVLDREKIDPWTREVMVDNTCKGVVDALIGLSPTSAPSGYLAETAGKHVIMTDGKEGHVLRAPL
eukprot:CAMPEP_0168457884 /NCGR_PEP_ID=MMETSP0228-20121227/52089_1 /TAXON_ID=133427 /ORGANISM="Protoceratium reticulatum, Strain CCCM 535 (=CCMP 1889)" /LENGTH=114 /DNA_ID=CAMNT_0008472961 /DNA_START=1 /DNA_END=342 /DNA_ORIENTATION=+